MKNMIIAIMFLFSCRTETKTTEKIVTDPNENTVILNDVQYNNARIETARLQERTISSVLRVNGSIDVAPQNIVTISAPLGGYLRSTRLLPGMHIRKGEVIAVLEDQQYIQLQQDYLLAKSRLHLAELEYKRQKELNQSQASSDKVTQQAQAEVSYQNITMKALAEKLRLINKNPESISPDNISKSIYLYSSITGFVSKVNVNIGKYVSPSDVLFELINPSDIHLKLRIFEKDLSKLSIGQNVEAYNNTQPVKKYNCKIKFINRNINPDGTAEVHCDFVSVDKDVLPGMYMNAEIQVKATESNVVPEESLVSFAGKEYVFIEINKNQYEMLEVSPGTKENGFVAIANTETLKDKAIVTKGSYTLLMKLKNREE